jgi:hypothetical protein
VCLNTRAGSVALVPKAGVLANAGAAVNIIIAKAGMEMQAKVMQVSFVPSLTLSIGSSGKLKACFDAKLTILPLTMAVVGYYQTLTCFGWERVCCFLGCVRLPLLIWCDRKDVVLVDVSLSTIVIPLFSVCIGPGAQVPVPSPMPSSSIHAVQIGTDLSLSWDACMSPTAIEEYVVCVESRANAADVAPCVSVGSAKTAVASNCLARSHTGDRVFVRVQCVTVDGKRADSVSASVVVDMSAPTVRGITLQRLQLVSDGPSVFPLSSALTNTTSARLQFTVSPSRQCVAMVEYAVSEANDPTNVGAYLFDFRSAGPGSSTSTAVVPSPGPADSNAVNSSVDGVIGWLDERTFDVDVHELSLQSGRTYYAVVRATGCNTAQSLTSHSVGLTADVTPPTFSPLATSTTPLTVSYTYVYFHAKWVPVIDDSTGVAAQVGQFFVGSVPLSDVLDVTALEEVQWQPDELVAGLDDGTVVSFVLTAWDGAGGSLTANASVVVDFSPPECGEATVLGSAAAKGVLHLLDEPDATEAAMVVEVTCVDAHSGVSAVTAWIGASRRANDVAVVTVPIDGLLVVSTTHRATALFRPVSVSTYYATLTVLNGVGLAQVVEAPVGVTYTVNTPEVRQSRFALGRTAGMHNRVHSNSSVATYATDELFFDAAVGLLGGTVTLEVCPTEAECYIAETLPFVGDPPSVAEFSGLVLNHGDTLRAHATWCNNADLCASATSPSSLVRELCNRCGCLRTAAHSATDLPCSTCRVFPLLRIAALPQTFHRWTCCRPWSLATTARLTCTSATSTARRFASRA